jgi:translation elongation factor EF-G
MAYAEEEQRAEDRRRERAGLATNPDLRNEVANEEGENWEIVHEVANEYMEENVSRIEKFITEPSEDNKELRLSGLRGPLPQKQEIKDVISKKIKSYLGEDFPDISIDYLDYDYGEDGYNSRFVLKRQEIQEG